MAQRRALVFAALVSGLWASAPALAGADLAVREAWVRAALPGRAVTAAYCELTNHGAESVTVVGFTGAGRVEMHQTVDDDGMARMRPLPRIVVAPGETVALAPGGRHLMLFNFALDDAAELTLHAVLDTGESLPVRFEVRTGR